MSYLYEGLSADRFQQFCQALLAAQFPNVQCLPVGQPDGGRDAFYWREAQNAASQLYVFQVKFVRHATDRDLDEFIEGIVKLEKPKVQKLIEKGAKAYYLLTNAAGTAHLEVGSIDRLNSVLSTELGLPSYCWWRDDLDRRVDNSAHIKWSYPEIIRGSDLLQALLEGAIGENAQRRNDAIRAYLAAQFKDDEEVKFKQVDLFNNLLDLFVDVPIRPVVSDDPRHYRSLGIYRSYWSPDNERFYAAEGDTGAAEFLLSAEALRERPRVVVEGAPGQGKSTITQYICQVQRMRLLGYDLARIPDSQKTGDVRLPFRIDLRDFASWIIGSDPFAADPKTPRPAETNSSLESFLAYQVTQLSGGHAFSVSDLSSIARASTLLIVLDGFDEVANVPTREQVVKEINRSVSRLETSARALQVVVTSRPAAFANSPGFSDRSWAHCSLESLTGANVNEYSEKWMKARTLSSKDASDFRAIISQKLSQPHMRDLARNPMQLAILLNLIQTRGLSLPDKRTSLYDNYMELFFSREAEKSPIVREHRDLLVDLHRFVAWVIHTESEGASGKGSISEDRLKQLLVDYLAYEGHPTALVEQLFTGMVERVVALVSRVQGTFEFEVQPLREYFAARHLYDTAPYSPPGDEKRGTKPERFDGIARNFYWLNVTRFYCGCFSKGELGSLFEVLAIAKGPLP